MTKVFLSPSSQTANLVHGGGHEQQYARARCARAAEVLRAHGVTVKVSSIMNDSAGGYFRSVAEGNAWGPDLYVADHTNATGLANSQARGVHNYCWLPDPASVNLGRAIGARMDRIIGGTHQIRDGSHLYEVNGPECTAVLLENGFHDNAQDAAIIRSKPREMGEAIAYGILDYLGIPVQAGTKPSQIEPKQAKPGQNETSFEELIEMNAGIYWVDGKVYNYLVFNTFSGWSQEFNNGSGGPIGGAYSNPLAATLRTGSWAKVSKSHAEAIKRSLADLRAGKVEVSGTVTIEGADQ